MSYRSLYVAAGAATLAVACAASPALAQPAGPPWTGFYVGAVIGAGWGDAKARSTVTTGTGAVVIPPADAAALGSLTSHDETKSGFIGGVEGGYNYQMGNWVFGVEADWSSLDLKNSNQKTLVSPLLVSPPITYSLNQQIRTDWMVSLRPRIGYAWGPLMVYGTGGLAWSELKYNATFFDNRSPADTLNASSKSTKTGWVAGLGAAYAFTPNVSFKGEWLHTDFGHVGSATTNSFVSITPTDSVQANLFRVGVDYHF